MPTIIFGCGKGGVGKSTSAFLLATEIAQLETDVTVIDADPNKPLSGWAGRAEKNGGKPGSLTVVADVTEDTIIDEIEAAALKSTFVIVDLEGTASTMVGYAMSRADLVVIPIQGSYLDATEANKAVALVRRQERAFKRKIPFSLLFTRTSTTIRPRTMQSIASDIAKSNLPVFDVQINERDAYKAVFSFGSTLADLDTKEVPNVPAAIANARSFVAEVLALLKNQSAAEPAAEVA